MTPAFADPVMDAQATFRSLMEAMARPGRIEDVASGLTPPSGLHPGAAAVLLTLADADTLLWTDAGPTACDWLAFHTGVRFTHYPGQADLLLATIAPPPWADIRAGTDEAPQDGGTLILQVPSLEGGPSWVLTGPGIEHEHRLAVTGLPSDFASDWRSSAARFPRGFDIVLAAGHRIAALPRTTRIVENA